MGGDKKMDEDDKWITQHFEELVDKYGGKYVAVVSEQVVAVGDSPKEVDEKARQLYPDKLPSVLLVPKEEDLTCILQSLRT